MFAFIQQQVYNYNMSKDTKNSKRRRRVSRARRRKGRAKGKAKTKMKKVVRPKSRMANPPKSSEVKYGFKTKELASSIQKSLKTLKIVDGKSGKTKSIVGKSGQNKSQKVNLLTMKSGQGKSGKLKSLTMKSGQGKSGKLKSLKMKSTKSGNLKKITGKSGNTKSNKDQLQKSNLDKSGKENCSNEVSNDNDETKLLNDIQQNQKMLDKIIVLMESLKAEQVNRNNMDDLDKLQSLIKNMLFRIYGESGRIKEVVLSPVQRNVVKMITGIDEDLDMLNLTFTKDCYKNIEFKKEPIKLVKEDNNIKDQVNLKFEKLEFIATL